MHQGNNHDSPLNLRLERCASYSRSEALILQKRAKHLPLTACLSGANPITPWYSWDLWLQTVTNICDNEINDDQCNVGLGLALLGWSTQLILWCAQQRRLFFVRSSASHLKPYKNQSTSSQLTGNEKVCGCSFDSICPLFRHSVHKACPLHEDSSTHMVTLGRAAI